MDHASAMLAFLKLSGVSQTRQQLGPRDKFLVLGGAAALKAGWPVVAERCRDLVLSHNPAHHLGHYATFAEALTNEEFNEFFRQLCKFCSYERAEHLLTQLRIAPGLPPLAGNLADGDYALLLLAKADTAEADNRGHLPVQDAD
jgi:hypothetical protein